MSSVISSVWALVRVGERLSWFDALFAYAALPMMLLYPFEGVNEGMRAFCAANAAAQLALFLAVVQLPGLFTGKMSYVDIGWPSGLVVISVLAYSMGTGNQVRKAAACGALFFHGARMAVGALAMFFPYTFPNGDLPRYKFAKIRWLQTPGGSALGERWWPLKAQLDTFGQATANAAFLSIPVALCAFNVGSFLKVFLLT